MAHKILVLLTLFAFTACASLSDRDPASDAKAQTEQRDYQREMNGLFNQ